MSSVTGSNRAVLKNYSFSILLLSSIAAGALAGCFLKDRAVMLKPFGDVFLNLLFTAVVPVVFFSISSAVSGMSDMRRLRRILIWMIVIFVVTGLVSAFLMIAAVKAYPPYLKTLPQITTSAPAQPSTAVNFVQAFTVSDFADILSKKTILALIVFSLLVGLAASGAGEAGKPFVNLLASGNEVMMKLISLIMLYAPVGLGAYFAYLTGVFGPDLFGTYLRAVLLYYSLSAVYFLAGFTFYAWAGGGMKGVRIFWTNIWPAALTALATGSSLATIPANLQAADREGIPEDVSRIVIPIGATIHMDGTCLSAILKIALLFNIFHIPFSGLGTLATAAGIAVLSGVVMSGIPGGGFLGELLIVTLYKFPPESLPLISMLGTLVDPPATMVNSTGDNVVSMIVARVTHGKDWLERALSGRQK